MMLPLQKEYLEEWLREVLSGADQYIMYYVAKSNSLKILKSIRTTEFHMKYVCEVLP